MTSVATPTVAAPTSAQTGGLSSVLRQGDELLLVKSRCSELELILAQQNELIADLSRQNVELRAEAEAHTGGGKAAADGALASLATRDSNYQLRKEIVALTEQKTTMEQQLHRVNEAMSALQLNLTREIQKAKEEGERQSVFLRSQLIEAREHAALLQEKLVGQAGLAQEAFRGTSMNDAVTERILITSDSVLHRLKRERPVHSYRSKYDVVVEFDGRHMVLSGSRLNVQLLKAEVLETLNGFYASMSDPAKYVPAAKARESARNAEADHLRRTVATHETTIQSLHKALQGTQERADECSREADLARSEQRVAEQKAVNERSMMDVERAEHDRKTAALVKELHEAEETARAAVRSLQSEAQVSKQLRNEVDGLRKTLEDVTAGRELAERTSYVAREQARATEHTFSELMERALKADAEARRADNAERELRELREKLMILAREREQNAEATARERGRFEERLKAEAGRVAAESSRLKEIVADRDQTRQELVAANNVIAELRERLGGARSAGSNVEDMTTRLRRLELENERLREELQRSFNDMKSMAAAMADSKGVRERALQDVDRLQMERSKMLEERQRIEMEAVQAKMLYGSREAELHMALESAQEEAQHHRARADMLHNEYHAKLSTLLSPGGPDSAHDYEAPSAAAVRGMLRSRAEAGSRHQHQSQQQRHASHQDPATNASMVSEYEEPRAITPIPIAQPQDYGPAGDDAAPSASTLDALAEAPTPQRQASQSPTAGTATSSRFQPTSPGTFGVVATSSTRATPAGGGQNTSTGLNTTPRGAAALRTALGGGGSGSWAPQGPS